MKVEVGKYYRLKPRDYSSIVGKCTGFTKIYPVKPVLILNTKMEMNGKKDRMLLTIGQLKSYL